MIIHYFLPIVINHTYPLIQAAEEFAVPEFCYTLSQSKQLVVLDRTW